MTFHQTIGLVGLLWAVTGAAAGAEKSRYWELGWGLYGGEGLDAARFDWHMICFGNVPATQQTVDGLNEILKLNPKHKFLIRVWPIMGKGDCKENRYQATLFHYLYKPGVREKVLEETKRQVELVCKGVSRPESVYGCCFLEELPGHFTSGRFGGVDGKAGAMPWDIQRFQKPIEAELGAPWDGSREDHRLWWGRKYCQVIEEINRTMKQSSGGKPVFYYQATSWCTLDHLDLPLFREKPPRVVMPFRYSQILKPGVCDGIFGYPNNAAIWANQTEAMLEKYSCLMFSQMSLPPGMRICRFNEMVDLARWNNPGNVGSFLYGTHGRKARAWNSLEYQDDSSYWTVNDHARRFAWDRQIGTKIVDRALAPLVQLVYDFTKLSRDGFSHVFAQVTNPREPSWYGGNVEPATLRDVSVTLTVPAGFRIPPRHSAPAMIRLGDLPPLATTVADWWIEMEKDAAISAEAPISVALKSAGAGHTRALGTTPVSAIPSFQQRTVTRSGDRWAEPLYNLPSMQPTVDLVARADILCPELGSETRTAVYRDLLRRGERLILGPGLKARLFPPTPTGKSPAAKPSNIPQEGLDVSAKLQGVLPPLEPPFTPWIYRDLSDPERYGRPKLELRFLSPEDTAQR